jgi:hypothetical protein
VGYRKNAQAMDCVEICDCIVSGPAPPSLGGVSEWGSEQFERSVLKGDAM